MLRKAAGVDKGSATTSRTVVGSVTRAPAARDRPGQDGRPQRHRPRRGGAHRRGHRALHGHRGHRLASIAAGAAGVPVTEGSHGSAGTSTPRPRGRPDQGRTEEPTDAPPRQAVPGAGASSSTATQVYCTGRSAVDLLKDTAKVNFDPSVEAHIRLGVDPRHADQMVRGTVVLPHGVGKTVRVLVFAQGDKAQEALKRRRRRGRWRGPRQAHRGRLAGVRRRARDART